MADSTSQLPLDLDAPALDAAVGAAVREQPALLADNRKANGVHYTPADLARFVARRGLGATRPQGRHVIYDPACGDGELLLAVAEEAERRGLDAPRLFGTDTDPAAVAEAERRLTEARAEQVTIRRADFLDLCGSGAFGDLEVDLMISNPPYVRTQVLGAARAQSLASQFGLTGRVDLYHAFVAAMTLQLPLHGVLALLCSNRFLTTRGGNSLRELLDDRYSIREIWDLGDSKLFDAAVLPAVLIATRGSRLVSDDDPTFVRVYEAAAEPTVSAQPHASLLAALEGGQSGPISIERKRLTIERGVLADTEASRPWQLSSPTSVRWLETVRQHSAGRLRDFGPLRVGIKTTADKVFISDEWDDLPEDQRPEPSVLRPLLTHHVAARWTSSYSESRGRRVLYTHEASPSGRRPIGLAEYPRAAAYLEQHRERLEGRKYVQKAGRRWYEIWVPQQPEKWTEPKLVWPDISEEPRFFLDKTGAVVNGDCYWLPCGGAADEDIALMLAVANSSFTLTFYDTCCGNRLYSGRRRFITQYLEDLPVPNVSSESRSEIAAMVRQLRGSEPDENRAIELALDDAVHQLFGVEKVVR